MDMLPHCVCYLILLLGKLSCYFDFYLTENEANKLYGIREKIYYIKESKLIQMNLESFAQKNMNISLFIFNWFQSDKEKIIHFQIKKLSNQSSTNDDSLRLSVPEFGMISDYVPHFILFFNCSSNQGNIEINLTVTFTMEMNNYPENIINVNIFRYRNCSKERDDQRQFSYLQDSNEPNVNTWLGIVICGIVLATVLVSMILIIIRRVLFSHNVNIRCLCSQTKRSASKKPLFINTLMKCPKPEVTDNKLELLHSKVSKENCENDEKDCEPSKDNDAESFFTLSSVGTHQTGATPIINRRLKDPLHIINEIHIPRSKIILKNLLLEGTFCQMYEAIMCQNHQKYGNIQKKVMIKTLADSASISQANVLIKDGTLLAGLKHHNLNPVIRACTASYQGHEMIQPPWLIYTYAKPGNLKLILQRNAYQDDRIAVTFSTPHLIVLAIQLLKAMKYLHDRNIIHKDIATRNCFLNEQNKVMLCDSALSRDTFPEDYQCLGDNENRPVKWLSVEALIQRRYSQASDIWAFGILLWELVTKADLPYSEIDPFEMPTYLRNGYRLRQPLNCPDNLWTIMHSCWDADFAKRPTLTEVAKKMKCFQTLLTDFV